MKPTLLILLLLSTSSTNAQPSAAEVDHCVQMFSTTVGCSVTGADFQVDVCEVRACLPLVPPGRCADALALVRQHPDAQHLDAIATACAAWLKAQDPALADWLPPTLRAHYLTLVALSGFLALPPPSLATFLERELPLWGAPPGEHPVRLLGALAHLRYRTQHDPEMTLREGAVRLLAGALWPASTP